LCAEKSDLKVWFLQKSYSTSDLNRWIGDLGCLKEKLNLRTKEKENVDFLYECFSDLDFWGEYSLPSFYEGEFACHFASGFFQCSFVELQVQAVGEYHVSSSVLSQSMLFRQNSLYVFLGLLVQFLLRLVLLDTCWPL
jgi:hypothetical protein